MCSYIFALTLFVQTAAGQTPSVPPAQTPAAPTRPQNDQAAYVVGPGDVLNITVYGESQLSGKYRVDNSGTFTFPLLADRVEASGQTIRSIEDRLRTMLADGYLRNPQVSVEVEQFKSQNVFIIGEVRSPGKYAMTGNMTLIEALAQAGGTTSTASSDIAILHAREGTPDGPLSPTDDGRVDVTNVSLKDLQRGFLAQNVQIQDGDTIFVPKAETFFIGGQVKNPGSYVMESGMTVLQAISLAGGLSERGATSRIKITRMVGGKSKEIKVKLTDTIQPGDTITVPQKYF